MPRRTTQEATNNLAQLKQTFHNFDTMPENFKILFNEIGITEKQKEKIVQETLTNDKLLELIANDEMAKFIDSFFQKSLFTEEQKKMANYQLTLAEGNSLGFYHSTVNESNILGKRRQRSKTSYVEYNSEPETMKANLSEKEESYIEEKNIKNKKYKFSEEDLFEKINECLRDYSLQIYNTCKDFLDKKSSCKTNTMKLRKIVNGYFSFRLIIGPMGDSKNMQDQNAKLLVELFEKILQTRDNSNIIVKDHEGSWKKNNIRKGYIKKNKKNGEMIMESDPTGSIIIIGSTAITCAQAIVSANEKKLTADTLKAFKTKGSAEDFVINALMNFQELQESRNKLSSEESSDGMRVSGEDSEVVFPVEDSKDQTPSLKPDISVGESSLTFFAQKTPQSTQKIILFGENIDIPAKQKPVGLNLNVDSDGKEFDPFERTQGLKN